MALALQFYEADRVVIEVGGKHVVVKVHKIQGNKVKLSFVAERDVVIRRESVFDKMGGVGSTDVVEQHIERLQVKPRAVGTMKPLATTD